MPVLLFPWCLLNSWPELHSDFLVFLSMSLFLLFSKVCIYDLLSNPMISLWCLTLQASSAQPFTSGQWELRLQEAVFWNARHPAAEADQTLTLPFIHSFVHSSLIFWACGLQLLGIGTMWDILWPCPVSSFVKSGRWQSCLEDQR